MLHTSYVKSFGKSYGGLGKYAKKSLISSTCTFMNNSLQALATRFIVSSRSVNNTTAQALGESKGISFPGHSDHHRFDTIIHQAQRILIGKDLEACTNPHKNKRLILPISRHDRTAFTIRVLAPFGATHSYWQNASHRKRKRTISRSIPWC